MRPTYAEIDLSAIKHNTRQFLEMIGGSELCAVVKADAYGHGDVPVATAALDAGVTSLAVALVEEGARLRDAGIEAPILVLSEPDVESIPLLQPLNLTTTVYSTEFVDALASSGTEVAVHIKVDTGMHRVGVMSDGLPEIVDKVEDCPNLRLEGVFTHFPVADEDPDFTRHQIELFDQATAGITAEKVHLANSAGTVLFPEARRDMCRVGLSLYGLHAAEATRDLIELKPAMRVVSHVAYVRDLPREARPSYGRVRALPEAGPVATIPIGYADGYTRRLTANGTVLIRGKRFPFAGMVTMDQVIVDVDETVEVGDEVVLMGTQGDDRITADELAAELGTITHEIVTKIGPRVPRRYVG